MWRSTGAVFAALGVLAIGAAAAAVAALNQHAPARRTVTNIVGQTPAGDDPAGVIADAHATSGHASVRRQTGVSAGAGETPENPPDGLDPDDHDTAPGAEHALRCEHRILGLLWDLRR
jgi:hypothetical protein